MCASNMFIVNVCGCVLVGGGCVLVGGGCVAVSEGVWVVGSGECG